jgi:hypothetical protein
MTGERVVRRLAAILAADVAGYSRFMGRDEHGTLAALKTVCQEVVDPAIASHGGRIVNTDDGLLFIGHTGGAVSHRRLHLDGTAHGVSDTWRTPVALLPIYIEKCHTFNSIEAFQAGFGPHAKDILANIPDYTDRVPVRSNLSFLLPESGRTTIARSRKGGRSCH